MTEKWQPNLAHFKHCFYTMSPQHTHENAKEKCRKCVCHQFCFDVTFLRGFHRYPNNVVISSFSTTKNYKKF